jgi:hypothetical protein
MKRNRIKIMTIVDRVSIALTIALIAGAGVEGRQFRPPPDASAYRQRVKDVAALLPMTIGNWIATNQEVEQSAVKILHPNVIISRQYRNALTGQDVGFLFVDVQDARDTVGHYPPICYPAQGWSTQVIQPLTWRLPDRSVNLTEYTFVSALFDKDGTLVVDDFFVLPQIGIVPNRDPVIAAARDLSRRFYGVAQVQFVFLGDTTAAQRESAFHELITPAVRLIDTVQTIHSGQANPADGGMQ